MSVLKRLTPAAALMLAISFTACGDATSPDDVNAGTFEAGFSTVTETFNNNAAFQSMSALSAVFPSYAGVAVLQGALPERPMGPTTGSAAVAQLRARAQAVRLLASLRANPQALFPTNVLGKTLVWDTLTHAYAISNLTGAPANGIRLQIYAVNPVTREPIVPVQQLGYVDLTDESSAAADRLGVLLTLGATTIADYEITLATGTVRTELEAQGYIRNAQGAGRVDFDFLSVADVQAQTFTSSAQLDAAGSSIFVEVHESNEAVTLTVRVQHEGNRIVMDITVNGSTSSITGTVKFNGFTVGTISGDVDAPVFTASNGRTLTQEEIAALIGIFEKAVEVATDLGDAVYGPAHIVFN